MLSTLIAKWLTSSRDSMGGRGNAVPMFLVKALLVTSEGLTEDSCDISTKKLKLFSPKPSTYPPGVSVAWSTLTCAIKGEKIDPHIFLFLCTNRK